MYIYDFGDNWIHFIEVVGSIENETSVQLPALLDGENDAPPEDCGGPMGFADFLAIMNKPRHKEHKEMKEWAEMQQWERFDFRNASINVYLAGNPGRGVWVKEG